MMFGFCGMDGASDNWDWALRKVCMVWGWNSALQA